jgi:TonB family protein
LKKGVSYRFYVVDYNDDDLTNNLVYMEKNINPSEVQEVNPIKVDHARGYNYADFLIEETAAYHVHLPNITPNNKFIFGLYILEANQKISTIEKKPKTTKEVTQAEDQVFVVCEVLPEFIHPDYEDARDFIAKNLKYPAEAVANKIEGRVFVQFIVNKDGSVNEAKVVRGVNPILDNEALRVVNIMPNWVPGTQSDEPVRVALTFPITFKL